MSKRNQLIIFVSVLTLASVIATLGLAQYFRDRLAESLIAEEAETGLILAEQTTSLLETEVQTIQEKVGLLTQIPAIREADTEACNAQLAESAPYIESQLGNITRFNTQLMLDCAINQQAIGYVLTPDSPVTAVIRNPAHAVDLSYSGYSPITKQEVLYLNLPVFSMSGEYRGIIGGVVYLNYLGDKYLKHLALSPGSEVTLIDDNGHYLFHPKLEHIGKNIAAAEVGNEAGLISLSEHALEQSQAGQNDSRRFTSGGQEFLAVYSTAEVFPGRKWTLLVTTPITSILSNVTENRAAVDVGFPVYLYTAVVMIFVLFAAIVLFFTINRFFKPFNQISQITQAIGGGDLEAKIHPRLLNSRNEFGQLARSIKQMAKRLQRTYHDLEERVLERTKELEQAKADAEQRAQELATTNKFLVDRELKMVVLKKENDELKKKLKK